MKTAFITVTDNGARLAEKMAANLTCHIDLYAKAGREGGTAAQVYESLSILVDDIYHKYNGLVFIMATGIVVRLIAPHIRDKRYDPAVVVMDEAGKHAISLLAGHIGGANELARVMAKASGGTAVITTATDTVQKPAPDVLAARIGLEIEPFDQLKSINAAIVAGQRVVFFVDHTMDNHERYVKLAAEQGIITASTDDLANTDHYDAAVVITDKELYMVKPHIFLRPATLAIGVGCRRGVPGAALYTAIADACRRIGRSANSIAVLATSTAKEEEIGLLAIAQQMAVPFVVYDNAELKQCIEKVGLNTSAFVEEKIGVGNVCEPAALLAARTDTLLLGKTVYDKITIAIAEVRSPS